MSPRLRTAAKTLPTSTLFLGHTLLLSVTTTAGIRRRIPIHCVCTSTGCGSNVQRQCPVPGDIHHGRVSEDRRCWMRFVESFHLLGYDAVDTILPTQTLRTMEPTGPVHGACRAERITNHGSHKRLGMENGAPDVTGATRDGCGHQRSHRYPGRLYLEKLESCPCSAIMSVRIQETLFSWQMSGFLPIRA